VFYNNVITKKNAFSDQTLSIFSGQNACVRDRDYHSDRYTHTLQSFGYYQKTFNEREWRRRKNRWQIVFTLPFLLEDLPWARYFGSVYAAMSLLKLFQVQGINPKCESVIYYNT